MNENLSNFNGDWNELCPHCSKPHKLHTTAEQPLWRFPCQEEKDHKIREGMKFAFRVRSTLFLINFGKWLFLNVLFPVIGLLLTAWGFVRQLYDMFRGWIVYWWRSKFNS